VKGEGWEEAGRGSAAERMRRVAGGGGEGEKCEDGCVRRRKEKRG